jgi:hypothetical protein
MIQTQPNPALVAAENCEKDVVTSHLPGAKTIKESL